MSSPPKPLNHSNFFVESNRIVAENNRHFIALSFLFFFPLFCSVTSLIPLFRTILVDPQSFHLSNYYYTSIYIALYALFVFSLYVAGVATIIYSTQQGLYGKPVNLLSTLKSLSHSFLPLASTTLASTVCLVSVLVAFLLLAASILNEIQTLGLEIITPDSNDLMMGVICIFGIGILLLCCCCCQVNLMLAAVIAVTESKWGFEPLRQSFYLVKGMKGSSLSMLLLRMSINFVFVFHFSISLFSPSGWEYLIIMSMSLFATMFMIPFVTTYTVLYLYCKDLHEESGFDIARAEEISKDCVSLAMDDDKLARNSYFKLILVCGATLMLVSIAIYVFLYISVYIQQSNLK